MRAAEPDAERGVFDAIRGSPRGPILAQSWEGLATQGMLTRTVRDSALTLDVLAGAMPGDRYGRPALDRPLREEVSADITERERLPSASSSPRVTPTRPP